MIKKSLVLVAVSLSAYAAIYGHEPPVLSSWIPANPMNKARAFFVAAELPNGNILVAGGFDGSVWSPRPTHPTSPTARYTIGAQGYGRSRHP
jgi:hypothetical protein